MQGPDSLHESDKMQSLARTLDLFGLYRDEARKCGDAGAPLAGCVLLGSAMEAALLAMAQCFPEDVGRVVARRKSKELSRPASEWSLSQLLLVAHDLGWLPTGDYAEVVRAMRNLLHPSIYMRECPDKAINGKHLRFSFKVLDAACSCLSDALSRAAELIKRQEEPATQVTGEIL